MNDEMPPLYSAPRRFDAVGRCIYCPSKELPLSDEHTLADGFGGNNVLPEASCETCRKMTQRFEQIVMRDMVWPLRHAHRMHAKKRRLPDLIPAYVPTSEGTLRVEMPPDDIPIKAVFPAFPHLPGFLCGRDRDAPSEVEVTGYIDLDAVERAEASGWKEASIYFNESAFVRTLAKTAHAQAVGIYGLDRFDAFLPPIIRGEDPHWAYYVGRAIDGELEPNPTTKDHWVHLMTRDRDGLIIARIQLFAAVGAPIYMVVIGCLRALPFGLGMSEQPLMLVDNICGASLRPIDAIRDRLAWDRNAPTPRKAVVLDAAA